MAFDHTQSTVPSPFACVQPARSKPSASSKESARVSIWKIGPLV